jgi:hypothetical protein
VTTQLAEVLGARRRLAAHNAVRAAERLADGEERAPDVQLELDEALGDLVHYDRMQRSLAPLARELGPYRRGGRSILGDLLSSSRGDVKAAGRLRAHARATNADDLEQRDIGGSTTFASLPLWLLDAAAPLSTSVAPLLHLVAQPLPPGTDGTVDLIRWTTPPTAAAQNGFNGALSTPSIAEGFAGPTVRTYACRALASMQLLEQGRAGIDAQLIPAMAAAVDAQINADMLNADGTSGTVLGIRNTSSISTATYTDTTPTLAEAWPAVEGVVRAVELGKGGTPILVMAPRRLSWIRQRAVVEGIPLDFDEPTIDGATVSLFGGTVNVVADVGITTTNGAGTNEDVVVVLRSTDVLDCYVGPPRVQLGDVANNSVEVYVNCFRQVAFTSARLPAAVGVLSGSGLAAPTP